MSAENSSAEDRSSSFLAAGLIKQLEEERLRLVGEVNRLEAALEDERSRNAAEWRQFFHDAGLKNTVTGEAILSLDDFRVWKAQFDALRHMQKSAPEVPPAASSPPKYPEAPDTAPPPKPKRRSLYYYFLRLKPWIPAIVILSLFVIACVYYALDLQRISAPTKSASVDPPSHAVDYKTRYVGSVNSDFIHLDTCRHAGNIQEGNRVYYESIADALADGRSKCSTCLSGTSSTSSGGGVALIPVTPPKNGEIVKDTKEEKLAPLTVKTSGTSDYYIALRCIDSPGSNISVTETSTGKTWSSIRSYDMTFYVIGGKTAEILVPLAGYEIYYAVGNTWYGNIKKFGEDTQYYKCEDTFLFEEQWDDEGMYYSGWTITLYAVPGRNMASDEIPASEFPL